MNKRGGRIFVLECLRWRKPTWMKNCDMPRRKSTLWRLWGSRGELLFGFSSDAGDPTQMKLIYCLCHQTCSDPDRVLLSPQLSDPSLDHHRWWILQISRCSFLPQ